MLFWLIPVVAILAIVGAIFLTKWIRRSANDDSLFDDDQDEAPENDGFNVKILLAVVPLAALVIWAVLSVIDINAANECKEALASGSFVPPDGC